MQMGHNSTTELDLIANDARLGLKKVEAGEADVIEGWLIYGAALLVGREKFKSNEQFGQWLVSCNLQGTHTYNERSAAMWAAEDTIMFGYIRSEYPNIKTVRGLHAKWKGKQKAKPKPEPKPDNPIDAVVKRSLMNAGEEGVTRDDIIDEVKHSGIDAKNPTNSVNQSLGRIASGTVSSKGRYYDADLAPKTTAIDVPKSVKEHKEKLERQFAKRVEVEAQKKSQDWLAEHQVPLIHKKLNDLKKMLLNRKGVMTKKEHRTILAALHPDNTASVEVRNSAFILFQSKEISLTDGKTNPKAGALDIGGLRDALKMGSAA